MLRDLLDEFAYRIDLGWGVFVLTLVFSLGLARSTVIFIAVKAASVNPVYSIREE